MDSVTNGHSNENNKSCASAPEQHPCNHCPSVFRSKALLARHNSQLHRAAKKFQCTHCDAAYDLPKNFALHRTIHNPGNPPFKCPQCSIGFRRRATLVGHIERHYVSEDHICALCDDQFQTLDELKAHVYEGHEDGLRKKDGEKVNKIKVVPSPDKKVFKCNLCEDKVFSKRSMFERHLLIHTKQKPFECDICGKAFNQKSTLKTHSLVHSKIQEFVCLLCGLKFSQKVNLRVHILRVHPKRTASLAGRQPCPFCPCVFKKLGSLNVHKTRVHADLLADASKHALLANKMHLDPMSMGVVLKCCICGKDFQEKVQLNKHMRQHLNDVRKIECPPVPAPDIVQSIVASRSQEHMQGSNEQRRYSCEVCPAAFKKSSHLKQHTKSHYGLKGNRCGICNKTFTTSHTLKVHYNSHSQNSQLHYKCDQCTSSFSLQSSLRRHQKLHDNPNRSYSCPCCKRVFKWFQNCKSHIKANHPEVVADPIANPSDESKSNPSKPESAGPPELAEEMLIDLSNLPSNVSIVDISNLTNCIVKIDDQLYELPVQIETEHPLTEEQNFAEVIIPDEVGITIQPADEILRLNNSDDSLLQFIDEASQEDEIEMTFEPEEKFDTLQNQPKPKSSKMPNKTEQDLFEEVIEDGKKKFRCKGCRKVCKKPVDLRRHIRTHTGERPFQCDQCSKSFTLKGVLKAHLKTHESEREMLTCPEEECGAKFTSKTSLDLHRRIHTGDRPFQCGVCRLTFRTSGHMQAHMTSHARLAKRREQSNFEFLYRQK